MNFDLESHKPLREVVYDRLKMQILEGRIVPGTRMMEVSLAEEMDVSRTPVREAIRMLETDGLVVIEPRRGAYASEISVHDMIDTLTVRETLESLAASIAAVNIKPEEIELLREMLEEYTVAVDRGLVHEMIESDEKFHSAIVRFSRNKTLIRVCEAVQEMALRFRYLYYDNFLRYKTMPNEHADIIMAIENGNSEEAAAVAKGHISRLKDFLSSEEGITGAHLQP